MTSLIELCYDAIADNISTFKLEQIRYLPFVVQQRLLSLLITRNKLTNEIVSGFMVI